MSSAEMSIPWSSADLEMSMPGEAMTMDSVEEEMAPVVWQLFLVQGWSILRVTIDQIFSKLIVVLSIQLLLMILEDSLCVEEVNTGSLGLGSMRMNLLQFIARRSQTRLIQLLVVKYIQLH